MAYGGMDIFVVILLPVSISVVIFLFAYQVLKWLKLIVEWQREIYKLIKEKYGDENPKEKDKDGNP